MNDDQARLAIIAAKSQLLASAAQRGFWPGELKQGLEEIEREVSQLKSQAGIQENPNWS